MRQLRILALWLLLPVGCNHDSPLTPTAGSGAAPDLAPSAAPEGWGTVRLRSSCPAPMCVSQGLGSFNRFDDSPAVAAYAGGLSIYQTPAQYGDCSLFATTTPSPAVYRNPARLTLSRAVGAPIDFDSPTDSGLYFQEDGRLWKGGEALAVEADGGELPAFAIASHAPVAIEVTTQLGGTLRRDRDLSLTWKPADGADLIDVTIEGPGDPVWVECSFKASNGQGTVPAAALQALSAGLGQYWIGAGTFASTNTGGWQVAFIIYGVALDSSGARFGGELQLQ